jgi:hypothetical protein
LLVKIENKGHTKKKVREAYDTRSLLRGIPSFFGFKTKDTNSCYLLLVVSFKTKK